MNMSKAAHMHMGRKACAFLLSLAIMFSMFASMSTVAYAATTVNKEDLITSVTNPSNGTISFYLKVPAGTTVSYKVELIPNVRTGSIDTKSGSYQNSGSSQVSKKITVTTKYYSNKYTITASYSTGPARNRTTYSDVDSATSALKTTVYTNKFVWNDANIQKWQAGQRIQVALSFAITGTADIFVTKGVLSGALATSLGVALFVGDLYSAGTVTDTKTITSTPIKNWGYQFRLTPYNGGYTKELLIYDDYGRLHDTVSWGNVSVSGISLAAR